MGFQLGPKTNVLVYSKYSAIGQIQHIQLSYPAVHQQKGCLPLLAEQEYKNVWEPDRVEALKYHYKCWGGILIRGIHVVCDSNVHFYASLERGTHEVWSRCTDINSALSTLHLHLIGEIDDEYGQQLPACLACTQW